MVQTVFQIRGNKIIGVKPVTPKKVTITIHPKIKQKITIKYTQKTCNYPGCNNKFIPEHPHQLYCSKECRYYSDVDHTLQRVRAFRKKYSDVLHELPNYVSTSIGTGSLGEHRCASMDEEAQKISNEIKRLGL